MHNALLIARLTLQEALRKKLLTVLLILTALFVGFYLLGIYKLEGRLSERAIEAGLEGRSKTGSGQLPVMYATLFGMYLVFFLSSLMAVLSSVAAISGEIENGVLQSVLARPVGRYGLVFGRWLGFSSINVGYVLLLSFTLLGGVYLLTGYWPPAPLTAVALIALAVVLLTSLTILGSTLFSTLANGIGIFVLYGIGFTGGILQFIGTIADTPALLTLGRVANALMPTNALWLGASYELQPDFLRQMNDAALEHGTNANPFFSFEPVQPGLVLWAAILALLALALAMWRFRGRDV